MKTNFPFLRVISAILLCALVLTGCLGTQSEVPGPSGEVLTTCSPETEITTVHQHTFVDATCTSPKTCTTCNITTGEPLGHHWCQATCTTPASCIACGAVNGEANGHNWKAATCSSPMTCTTCGETEGPPSDHIWKNATCTAAAACQYCGQTKGKPLDHNWKDATCTAAATCIACGKTKGSPIDHQWKNATCTAAKTCKVCGKTKGSPVSHKYYKGTCSNCGQKDPNHRATTSTMVWIPTNGGKKYHSRSSCSNMKNPEKVTLSRAKQLGFTACKKCYG